MNLYFLYLIGSIREHFFHFLKLLCILCLFRIGWLLHNQVIVWIIGIRKCWSSLLRLEPVINLCYRKGICLLEVIVIIGRVVIFLIIIFFRLLFKVRLWVRVSCFEIGVTILVLSSIFLLIFIILWFSLMLKLLFP